MRPATGRRSRARLGKHPQPCQIRPNSTGAALLDSDPDVQWTGIDTGFAPDPGTLRAPDVAVAAPQTGSGWISGVPLLALKNAGRGQDLVRAEGLADAIVTVLEARLLVADEAIRARLRATRDSHSRRTWLWAAAKVESASELLAVTTEPTLEQPLQT